MCYRKQAIRHARSRKGYWTDGKNHLQGRRPTSAKLAELGLLSLKQLWNELPHSPNPPVRHARWLGKVIQRMALLDLSGELTEKVIFPNEFPQLLCPEVVTGDCSLRYSRAVNDLDYQERTYVLEQEQFPCCVGWMVRLDDGLRLAECEADCASMVANVYV